MDTKLYQITTENLDKSLYFYNQTKDLALKLYLFLKEYKESTKNYHSNLQKLFNQYLSHNITNANSNLNVKNNNSGKNESNNSIYELDNTKIENHKIISPLRSYLEKIMKFFYEQNSSIDLQISSLNATLPSFKSKLFDTSSKISEIKKEIGDDKNAYLKNYGLFEETNNNLLQKFENIEKDIVENVIEIKKRPKEKEELENNLNSKINDVLKFQNSCLEKLNRNKSFPNDLKSSSNEHIKNINECTILLFETLKNNFNNFITFFNKSLSLITSEINCQKEILNNKYYGEVELKNIINQNIEEISQNECNIKLKEYDIKILSDKNYFNNKTSNDDIKRKDRKSFNIKKFIPFKNINSNNNNINSENNKTDEDVNHYSLSNEDIYNIIKKMYTFSPINSGNYSLENELNKMKIIKITNKILYDFDNEEEIDEKEVNELKNLMKNKQYYSNFLILINNFRSKGSFEFSKKIFDIISDIFLDIINNISNEQNGNVEYDLENGELILTLSQTFYYLKNSEKIYLRSAIKSNSNVFKSIGYWKSFLHCNINNSIKVINQNNNQEVNEKKDIKKIQNIIFTNLLPTVSNMKDFEIKSEEINNVVLSVFEKYGIEKEVQENIMNVIKDINFQE